MIGDFMIEVIEPSKEPEDQQVPLPKFRNRFGQHFHSLAWYVDEPDLTPLFHQLAMTSIPAPRSSPIPRTRSARSSS